MSVTWCKPMSIYANTTTTTTTTIIHNDNNNLYLYNNFHTMNAAQSTFTLETKVRKCLQQLL